ncbi:unnamed protein product [Gadus morhua 'NCC']
MHNKAKNVQMIRHRASHHLDRTTQTPHRCRRQGENHGGSARSLALALRPPPPLFTGPRPDRPGMTKDISRPIKKWILLFATWMSMEVVLPALEGQSN